LDGDRFLAASELGLDRDVAKKELDLFRFTASGAAALAVQEHSARNRNFGLGRYGSSR